MAEELIDTMSTEWRPEEFKDDFRATLRKLVDARIAKHGKKATKRIADREKFEPGAATNVVDFMALLKKSLAAKERGNSKPQATSNRRKRTASARSRS